MSDDLTARIAELLKRRVRCGRTADRYLVGGEARPLLAEARDEITRLREWKADATEVLAGLKLLGAPSTQPEGET